MKRNPTSITQWIVKDLSNMADAGDKWNLIRNRNQFTAKMFYAWNQINKSKWMAYSQQHPKYCRKSIFTRIFKYVRRDWRAPKRKNITEPIRQIFRRSSLHCQYLFEVLGKTCFWHDLQPINFVYSFAILVFGKRVHFFLSLSLSSNPNMHHVYESSLCDSYSSVTTKKRELRDFSLRWMEREREKKIKHRIWYLLLLVVLIFLVEYDTDKSKEINKSSENRRKTTHDDLWNIA